MLRSLTVVLVLAWASLAHAGEITIATFNAEFLTRPKVHVKFGLKFSLKNEPQAVQNQWAATGFRDARFAEAAAAVVEAAISQGGNWP